MSTAFILKFMKILMNAIATLLLFLYLAVLTSVPLAYVEDVNILILLWLALAIFTLLSGWWLIWFEGPKLSWFWVCGFLALHAGLFFKSAIKEDNYSEHSTCSEAGGHWLNNDCVFRN